ncbi:MAG: hypothetical protein LBG27_08060 [Spirochaetaceae bacterium]|jgi:hypothetical protein|nr:hypothetical protein [Spirochaetaceae bacterium]
MRLSLATVFLFTALLPLAARDVPLREISDDSGLRLELKEGYFTDTPARVMARRPVTHTLPSGDEAQVRVETSPSSFTVILARKVANTFPGWAQGSWALTRNRRTGKFEHIRVFLRSDPYTHIQLRPDETDANTTLLDAVVYDAFIRRGLPLPVPFDRMLTMRLGDILSFAGERFPIRYYEPSGGDYRDVRAFIVKVRAAIGPLEFGDDGAIDEHGNYVYIETLEPQLVETAAGNPAGKPGLNCSGFAKWLIDGLLKPLTGRRLTINELKAPYGDRGSGITRPWDPVRDLFFGLDWTRNLAAAVQKALYPGSPVQMSEFEVRHAPFTQILVRKNGATEIQSYPEHIIDTGFAAEGIFPLLYTLAVDEPGNIYLAAISDDRGGPRPRLRRYFHVAALVPYFDTENVFRVVVFESAEETSFSRFRTRYPGDFINLVRIPIEGAFEPD